MEIFSNEFLNSAAVSGNASLSTVSFIAKNKEEFTTFIEQVNKMWVDLPENAKGKLKKMLRSFKNGNFRGALGNVIAHSILARYFDSTEYDPLIGSLTPDFKTKKVSKDYIFEVFCLGKDQEEHLMNKKMALLENELAPYSSNRMIWLTGNPIPNSRNTFEGIGQRVFDYTSSVNLRNYESDEIHAVDYDGATVFFRIHECSMELPLYGGWSDHGAYGNPQVDLLLQGLDEKLEKYSFPFSVCCVLDSTIWGPVYTLVEAILGKLVFQSPIFMKGEHQLEPKTNLVVDGTGFWGKSNPHLQNHLHIQSILFITLGQEQNKGRKLFANLHFIENPHSPSGLSEIFANVPNLLDANYQEDRLRMPGLRIEF